MTVIEKQSIMHHKAIFSGHFCYFCNNNCHVISIITYTTVAVTTVQVLKASLFGGDPVIIMTSQFSNNYGILVETMITMAS